MESIVFFGKGGIGKSTIASNLSVLLAAGGRKVLHVGCDPKMDSVISLMGRPIPPFIAGGVHGGEAALRKSVRASAITGVHCIEAGGPHPGVGCAGTGIGAMLDAMRDAELLEKDGYGAAVFDVLGDVVCGGFAAPLRGGFAKKAVLVVSEELLSLYAANKLIMMLNAYARNGVWLAGLAANVKDARGLAAVRDFAKAAGTRVLGVLERSPDVRRAEKAQKPVVLFAPGCPASQQLRELCSAVLSARPPKSRPKALSERDFMARMGVSFLPDAAEAPACGPRAAGARGVSPRELFERAGFSFTGIASSQVLCTFSSRGRTAKVSVMHADNYQEGMLAAGDWVMCFLPGEGDQDGELRAEMERAAAGLAGVPFDDLAADLCRAVDFPKSMDGFDALQASAARELRPGQQHMAFGQWYRFIFPNSPHLDMAPGSAMVEHGDAECRFNGCGRTLLGTFGPRGGLQAPLAPAVAFPRSGEGAACTDFTADDARYGDEEKLARALAGAEKKTGPGGLVELYLCCSPLVASGGPGAARGLKTSNGAELLVSNYNDFYEDTPGKAEARARFIARRLKAAGGRPSFDANLVGFGPWRGELAALLESAGVSCAPPGRGLYPEINSARLQVLSGPDPVYGPALDLAGRKWIQPRAPYGLAGTAAWLTAVSAALGRKGRRFSPPAGLAAKMKELSALAAGYSVTFVLASPGEAELLDGSPAVSGLPLPGLLREAGFRLRLLVYAPDKAEKKKAAETLSPLAGRERGVTLAYFSDPAGLARQLPGGPGDRLVYSDLPRDRRVAAAGRRVLHPSVLEPGYEGAVESASRLLRLCRLGGPLAGEAA